MIDRRLLGTWKSDRRRTFKEFVPKPGCPPARLRELKALFGKLVIRWGYRKYHTELDGHKESGDYEVIAKDSVSVVIRYFDELSQEDRLRQIHFEGKYYWITVGGNLREFFRNVKR
jgi:hypothetical protein